MDFNPPEGIRVITAEELNHMPPTETPFSFPTYELEGPVLIRGDIVEKAINATGGLWIEGNVEDCNIAVKSPAIQKIEAQASKNSGSANVEEIYRQLEDEYKKAAEAGIGLHIKGDVTHCTDIIAPNISITGNVVTHVDTVANRLGALGGYVHIDGNVRSPKRTGHLENWWTKHLSKILLSKKEPVEERMLMELDKVTAAGDITISGDVHGVGLCTEEGQITVGGKKSGLVITAINDKLTIESRPGQAAGRGERGGR